MATPSHVSILTDKLGLVHGPVPPSVESIKKATELLQKNHDENHVFYKDPNFHNHLVHNVLTRLALGANPVELEKSYDYDDVRQRATPETDENVIAKLHEEAYFYDTIGKVPQYTNFRVFFERLIEKRGYRDVVQEYVFSGSRIADALLALMYDGLFHSLIHLGLGIEFDQPSIIAEALAQAAIHPSLDTDWFFQESERVANEVRDKPMKTLVELASEARASEAIRTAAFTPNILATMKQKNKVFKEASGKEIVALAAQWRVEPASLERKTAEMISFCAYISGAAQRAGKERRIDFFVMHSVTSSLFLDILNRQSWISTETKARLVEWKARLDLAWYVTIGLPELHIDDVVNYRGDPSQDMGWDELYRIVNAFSDDDGHVAKFVRALKNGADVAKPFEQGASFEEFPVKGDSYLKIARMAHDSTINYGYGKKWVMMSGIDAAWQ